MFVRFGDFILHVFQRVVVPFAEFTSKEFYRVRAFRIQKVSSNLCFASHANFGRHFDRLDLVAFSAPCSCCFHT